MIRLQDWMLELVPAVGGSLGSCRYRGADILCPERKSADGQDPRNLSAFPMVPFIGRITGGCFGFDGRHVQLAANMPPEPHAIHGRGWQSTWQIGTTDEASVHLHHHHDGQTDWPWAYKAIQTFSVDGDTLSWSMSLTNQANGPMPAGLGWHPYFPRKGAIITADVTRVWQAPEPGMIANSPRPLTPATDLSKARPVCGLALDHCFSAGTGGVKLAWPDKGLALQLRSSSNLGHLTVYVPDGEPYFCVEPVSHAPDAINSTLAPELTGFKTLAQGETMTATIQLIAEFFDN